MSTPTPGATTTPQPPQPSGSPHPGATQLPSQGQSPSGPALPSPVSQAPPTSPTGPPSAPAHPAQTLPGPAPQVSPIGQNGVIDVTPTHLYEVTDALTFEQHSFHTVAQQLLDALAPYSKVGGKGSAAAEFSTEYLIVAGLFLLTHARSVVAIGGAAVGFNETGNNFGEAESATHPGPKPPFVRRPQPAVMFSEPTYGQVPAPGSSDENPVEDFLDVLDGNIAGDVVRWAVEEALRAGRALEILPLPNYLRVNEVSQIWLHYVTAAGIVEGQLIQTVNSVTDSSNGAWYDAMLWFCSSLWGTKAWGQSREGYTWSHDTAASPGMNHPVFGVLSTTAEKTAEALRLYAEAAQLVRTALRNILHKAIMDALRLIDPDRSIWDNVKSLGMKLGTLGAKVLVDILANIDVAKVNAAVDAYETTLRNQKAALAGLRAPLEEALRAVPTFQSEMARAEAFAARSLFEFSRSPVQTDLDSITTNQRFGIDLAGMEGVDNKTGTPGDTRGRTAHTIDRHIGLTPEQLASRLRDQSMPRDASTFENLYSANQFTRDAVNYPPKQQEIDNWIKRMEQDVANGTFNPNSTQAYTVPFGPNVVTGTSVSRTDYDALGYGAPATPVHNVKITLAYSPVSKSVFVVTCYPSP
ncbi:RNase A-like domain-containing protein [Streptomyces sp. NPDC051555]|uniref:RNase A-like domain-containing protein n=1 Tax=Streptomyces sp. NPDC051555 TaxID=3365657 RepID=UPI00378FDFD0